MHTNQDWRPHSLASDWEAAMFTPFPFSRTVGEMMGLGAFPTALASSAQLQLMSVETAEAALKATRHLIDVWRSAVRDRQDAFLQGWADQAHRLFAEAVTPESDQDGRVTAVDKSVAAPATSMSKAA